MKDKKILDWILGNDDTILHIERHGEIRTQYDQYIVYPNREVLERLLKFDMEEKENFPKKKTGKKVIKAWGITQKGNLRVETFRTRKEANDYIVGFFIGPQAYLPGSRKYINLKKYKKEYGFKVIKVTLVGAEY